MDTLSIAGNEVLAHSPEGQTAKLSIEDWLKKIAPFRMDTGDAILPDGLKAVRSRGPATLWFHQSPPRVYNFKWIAADSRAHYGKGTKYRQVRLALPYLIVMAVYLPAEDGRVQLSMQHNEAFFRTIPLETLDDELSYPALLNCSKFSPPEGRPLSWICTQHMSCEMFDQEQDLSRRMRRGLRALLHCLLETGFNYSSEHHEGSSWFNESRTVDPRLATAESWEAASSADPLFVLDVPWLKTGVTVRQLAERTFHNLQVASVKLNNAAALARLVFNHTPRSSARAIAARHALFH